MRDSSSTLSPFPDVAVDTSNDDRTPDFPRMLTAAWRSQWDDFIDTTLIEWGKDPSIVADPHEGIHAPTPPSIRIATQLALMMRDGGQPPPTRIVPDGEGGITFERHAGSGFQSLEVASTGLIEFLLFKDCRLLARQHFTI